MKILIVDDMSSIRALIKGVLKELGDFTLEEASNGEAALQKLRSGKFDLVISDWNMPVMTGIEMLTAIRQDNDLKNLSVIMLTAEATRENVVAASRLRINGYILKPFTPEKLHNALKQFLKLS